LLLTATVLAGLIDPLPAPVATDGMTDQVRIGTEQAVAEVLVPPPEPLQPQVKLLGLGPLTAVAVPALHRLLVGAANTGVELLALPHTPLTMLMNS